METVSEAAATFAVIKGYNIEQFRLFFTANALKIMINDNVFVDLLIGGMGEYSNGSKPCCFSLKKLLATSKDLSDGVYMIVTMRQQLVKMFEKEILTMV